jgi:hypothetical protein
VGWNGASWTVEPTPVDAQAGENSLLRSVMQLTTGVHGSRRGHHHRGAALGRNDMDRAAVPQPTEHR